MQPCTQYRRIDFSVFTSYIVFSKGIGYKGADKAVISYRNIALAFSQIYDFL